MLVHAQAVVVTPNSTGACLLLNSIRPTLRCDEASGGRVYGKRTKGAYVEAAAVCDATTALARRSAHNMHPW